MHIDGNLKKWAQETPEKICLIHSGQRLTYLQLENEVDAASRRLASQLQKGDRVAIQLNDPIQQILYLLATVRAGGIAVLLDPSLPADKRLQTEKKIQAALLIDATFILPEDSAEQLPAIKPSDLFLGAFSSGSTGNPKLIWRDHQSWTSAFAAQSQVFHLSGEACLYLVGSLVYTGNLNSAIHLLHAGGTLVFGKNRSPRTWVQEITAHQVSAIFMVPTHYRLLLHALDEPLEQISALVSCGAKMDFQTARQLTERFPTARFCEYYGASELGHVSYASFADLEKYPDSIGKLFPGVHVSLRDDLIWVESPYLAPDFRPFATVGDLGKINEEGYLFLTGREGDIINSGGIKIRPKEVEQVLNRCPGISEAVVKGIADPLRGQKVAAWIVKADPDLKPDEIKRFCSSQLSKQAAPQKIYFLEKLPLTTSGKPDYSKLTCED